MWPLRLEIAVQEAGWIDVWFGINTPRIDAASWTQTAGGAQLFMTATYLPLTGAVTHEISDSSLLIDRPLAARSCS